jgi:hypothetical protein
MNALSSRMPALDRGPSPAPPFSPYAEVARTTLYDQIGDSICADATEKLIADFGGRRLYIPIAPAPGDLLTRSIGLMAALAMARMFGGDRLMIPVASTHARRRARIVAMRAENVSISRIAHELRCTERYVYKVLALNRAPECSPSLDRRGRDLGCPAPKGSVPPDNHATSAPIAERLKRGPINQRTSRILP